MTAATPLELGPTPSISLEAVLATDLPRAPTLGRDDFHTLVNLTHTNRWLLRKSKPLYDAWSLCETNEQKELLIELLTRFTVVNDELLQHYCDTICRHILTNWTVSSSRTLVVAASDDSEADGSQLALQYIKSYFSPHSGWDESNFRNTMTGYDKYLKSQWTYILLDDFIGTGSKIVRKVRSFRSAICERDLRDTRVFVAALGAMKASEKLVQADGIDVFSATWLEKGIDGFNDESTARSKRATMRKLEAHLMSRYNGQYMPSLGYKGSQALFSIMGMNCPNNVFPIFWWNRLKNNVPRETILSRLR